MIYIVEYRAGIYEDAIDYCYPVFAKNEKDAYFILLENKSICHREENNIPISPKEITFTPLESWLNKHMVYRKD